MFPISFGSEQGSFEQISSHFTENLREYYEHPARYYLNPFRIFGNLYYVGDKKVCSHLINTGDGLIVFDSGYPHAAHLLLQSIWELGFDPRDVRYIIHSHGHFDHCGAGDDFRTLFGCKIAMSRVDYVRIQENPALALMEYAPSPFNRFPEPDILIDESDMISLGNTSITCLLAPGHTEGTLAFLFDVTDDSITHSVGYFGGMGFFSLFREFQKKYGIQTDMQQALRSTIQKLRNCQVDITLGNHPRHNSTLEKRAYMLAHPAENPFIDPEEWPRMLQAMEARLNKFACNGW